MAMVKSQTLVLLKWMINYYIYELWKIRNITISPVDKEKILCQSNNAPIAAWNIVPIYLCVLT